MLNEEKQEQSGRKNSRRPRSIQKVLSTGSWTLSADEYERSLEFLVGQKQESAVKREGYTSEASTKGLYGYYADQRQLKFWYAEMSNASMGQRIERGTDIQGATSSSLPRLFHSFTHFFNMYLWFGQGAGVKLLYLHYLTTKIYVFVFKGLFHITATCNTYFYFNSDVNVILNT